jgi:hypothetical protein
MQLRFCRWRLWLAVVLPTAALLVSALLLIPSPRRVSRADFNRIEDGMSEADVARIMLRKADWRGRVPPSAWSRFIGDDGPATYLKERLYWAGGSVLDDGRGGVDTSRGTMIIVWLDSNGMVDGKIFVSHPEPSFMERLRNWLRAHGV